MILGTVRHVVCDNCGGVDWASLAVALVALVVSVWSIWLTALRRPAVLFEHIPTPNELHWGGYSGWQGTSPTLDMRFFAANTGASGTILRDVRITKVVVNSSRPQSVLEASGDGLPANVALPHPMERDDTLTGALVQAFNTDRVNVPTDTHSDEAEAYIRQVMALESVTVTVTWSWRQPILVDLKRPRSPRKSHYPAASATVNIATDDLKRGLLSRLESYPQFAELARLAHLAMQADPAA